MINTAQILNIEEIFHLIPNSAQNNSYASCGSLVTSFFGFREFVCDLFCVYIRSNHEIWQYFDPELEANHDFNITRYHFCY